MLSRAFLKAVVLGYLRKTDRVLEMLGAPHAYYTKNLSSYPPYSLWYATYCVVGIAVLAFSAGYYYVWLVLLPRWRGYTVVEEVVELPNGELTNRLAKVYSTSIQSEGSSGQHQARHPASTNIDEQTPLLQNER